MDDIFERNPVAGEVPAQEPAPVQEPTRTMPPVEAPAPQTPGRRRRTERNAARYGEAAALAAEAVEENGTPGEAAAEQESVPAETVQLPVSQHAPSEPAAEIGTTAVPRFQTRYAPPVPGSVPSQGVPRPTALNQPAPRRPVFSPGLDEVRRPVQAEGYVPARPLGVRRVDTQDLMPRKPVQQDTAPSRRSATVMPTMDDGEEYEGESRSHALPVIIIVLLVIAALVLGLLLIPDDMEGPLGDFKRSVTGLFGGGETKAPAQALDFTGEPIQDSAPYQVDFHITTTNDVTDVRVVNERGEVFNTTVTASTTNTDNTFYLLSMTLAEAYQGDVYLQIFDGEAWLETDCSLKLTIGADLKMKVSETSSTTLTAGATAVATGNTTAPAGSVTAPTVSPSVMQTEMPVGDADVPSVAQTAPQVQDETPVVTAPPAQTPTAAPETTPTPTMAMTPTPTVRVTPTPTAEPTPEPTPKLEAVAGAGASPELIATQRIYRDDRRVDSYERPADDVINMPAGDEYLTVDFGVTTFRGNAFRMNAASGHVNNPTSMTIAWTVEGGSLRIASGMRYGFGVYSQPAIVKWTVNIRQVLALHEQFRTKRALKEVIISGQDGKIYFLDLETGEATREPISIGYALRGAPSVHPLGLPVITAGQFSNKLPSGNSKKMGLYYFNLVDNKQLRLINTLDDHAYYSVGAMDTSALIDRNSNTLIAIGSNGMLYTEKMSMMLVAGEERDSFIFDGVDSQVSLVSYTKGQKASYAAVESSLAMYGSYAFYADMDGILRCVDTTTMTTVWAVDTGDAVRASVALDLDEESGVLWLYTANTITNRSKNGDVTIRRYNAMTGELSWELPVHSLSKYAGQKDATGKEITAGAVASPVIGQHDLGDLVYFTLSSVSADGYQALAGKEEKQPSVLVAISKADGSVVWTLPMDAYSYSSPVAVYNEAGQGWVLQCCSNGTIYLLNGRTGEIVSTLQVAGIIEGSPAVYNDLMVFGTTGKDTSFVHAIRLQ